MIEAKELKDNLDNINKSVNVIVNAINKSMPDVIEKLTEEEKAQAKATFEVFQSNITKSRDELKDLSNKFKNMQ